MSVAVIIPARLAATRLPDKPLAQIAGKPMIQHAYERASQASTVAQVLVATPDVAKMEAVTCFGGEGAIMTSPEHRSGTDRVAEVPGVRTAVRARYGNSTPPCLGVVGSLTSTLAAYAVIDSHEARHNVSKRLVTAEQSRYYLK